MTFVLSAMCWRQSPCANHAGKTHFFIFHCECPIAGRAPAGSETFVFPDKILSSSRRRAVVPSLKRSSTWWAARVGPLGRRRLGEAVLKWDPVLTPLSDWLSRCRPSIIILLFFFLSSRSRATLHVRELSHSPSSPVRSPPEPLLWSWERGRYVRGRNVVRVGRHSPRHPAGRN